MHTYLHAIIHKYIHTCMYTYINTFLHSYIHTYMHTWMLLNLCLACIRCVPGSCGALNADQVPDHRRLRHDLPVHHGALPHGRARARLRLVQYHVPPRQHDRRQHPALGAFAFVCLL